MISLWMLLAWASRGYLLVVCVCVFLLIVSARCSEFSAYSTEWSKKSLSTRRYSFYLLRRCRFTPSEHPLCKQFRPLDRVTVQARRCKLIEPSFASSFGSYCHWRPNPSDILHVNSENPLADTPTGI